MSVFKLILTQKTDGTIKSTRIMQNQIFYKKIF